ncbi:hypothetical protein Tco_1343786 [Tanacetum coccineum]
MAAVQGSSTMLATGRICTMAINGSYDTLIQTNGDSLIRKAFSQMNILKLFDRCQNSSRNVGSHRDGTTRFVTIVKQQHKLDEVSYHKLFDILKQYQKEVNELRAERMAKNANPLALVATAQTMQDPYYQTPKHHKSYAPTFKASLPTRSNAATRHKGKEIAKTITPPSESASEEDSDPEQAQKDKDMQKNLALIAKYFKKLYKPTNNNLRTSSNTRNKNVDTNPRYKTDNQTGQFGNQRAVNVVGARETVDTNEEINEQELEAHYSYMAKIQEVPNADSGTDAEPLEQVHYDTDHNVFANDLQHFEQSESISNTCAVENEYSNCQS